jgi:hypothetical protein
MRNLFALLAAFFAGLWLNEQINRRRETERPIIVNVQAPPAPVPTEPKEVDRRPVSEVLPLLNIDPEMFDTKSSLVQHFCEIVREGMKLELTPLQAHDLGSDIIAIMSHIKDWEREQKYRQGELP